MSKEPPNPKPMREYWCVFFKVKGGKWLPPDFIFEQKTHAMLYENEFMENAETHIVRIELPE